MVAFGKEESVSYYEIIFWCHDWIGKRWSDSSALPLENYMIRKADGRNRCVFYRNVHMETCNFLLDQSLNKMNSSLNFPFFPWIFKILGSSTFFPVYLTGVVVLNQMLSLPHRIVLVAENGQRHCDLHKSTIAEVQNHLFTGMSSWI